MKPRWSATWLTIALSIGPACAPDDGTQPEECSVESHEIREGELFDIVAFGHDFSPFCDAGLQAAQAHGQWVANVWGEPPNPFDYGLFDSRDEPCWPCRSGFVGCAFATDMFATEMPERHEIAHSIRRVPCPTLLEEGWAMLYGTHFQDAETLGSLREAADSNDRGILAAEFYPLAARFVAFLLETRGIDGLKALCELSIDDSESLDAALMEVFGESLDEIEAEFSDYPTWPLGQLRQDQACEGTDITTGPGSWTMDLACGAPGVEGRDGVRLVTHHLVSLPTAGNYTFRFDAPVEFHVRLELRNCEREGMASVFYQPRYVYKFGTPAEVVFMNLPAGVYVVRLMLQDTSEPLTVDASVVPWP